MPSTDTLLTNRLRLVGILLWAAIFAMVADGLNAPWPISLLLAIAIGCFVWHITRDPKVIYDWADDVDGDDFYGGGL